MFFDVSRRFSQLMPSSRRPRLRAAKSGASWVLVAVADRRCGAASSPRAGRAAVGRRDEVEAPVAQHQHGQRERRPDDAVQQVHALGQHQARVALGDGPVFGGQHHGPGAEGVDQRGQGLVVEVARQLRRHHVADQHDDAADVDRQHAPRQRRQHEEDGAEDEDVGQDRAAVGDQIGQRRRRGRCGRRRCPARRCPARRPAGC